MAPSQFYFRLRQGIIGGFAPPTPDLVIEITGDGGSLQINIHEGGGSHDSTTKTETVAAHEALVDELHGILKELPMEEPRGSEDIYGLNVGIAWGSDDLEWTNGGPQGCSGGSSFVQASEDQKQQFNRAIEIVKEIANV
ncbi:hypothetical protein EDB82DRAFT_511257 [Fusarium venenatum]|uniref:uncharacterized protein n=1 Tax=Fusarium venenatum TaxID=56646 RepID=UPI001D3E01E2|nr:hypothetical protein EDB82DRAFT_511257 [Fusarium venenatum]